MKRARITMKRYEKVISSDNMPSQRDAKIQVYMGNKFVFADPKSKLVQVITI